MHSKTSITLIFILLITSCKIKDSNNADRVKRLKISEEHYYKKNENKPSMSLYYNENGLLIKDVLGDLTSTYDEFENKTQLTTDTEKYFIKNIYTNNKIEKSIIYKNDSIITKKKFEYPNKQIRKELAYNESDSLEGIYYYFYDENNKQTKTVELTAKGDTVLIEKAFYNDYNWRNLYEAVMYYDDFTYHNEISIVYDSQGYVKYEINTYNDFNTHEKVIDTLYVKSIKR